MLHNGSNAVPILTGYPIGLQFEVSKDLIFQEPQHKTCITLFVVLSSTPFRWHKRLTRERRGRLKVAKREPNEDPQDRVPMVEHRVMSLGTASGLNAAVQNKLGRHREIHNALSSLDLPAQDTPNSRYSGFHGASERPHESKHYLLALTMRRLQMH
jgi:hypothetical protein